MYLSIIWQAKGFSWNSIFVKSTLLSFGFGLIIELIQMFMVTRVADITDALNLAAGGFLGSFIVYYYIHHYKKEDRAISSPL